MRRLVLLLPWALGLALLLTSAPSADDPIEALRQAEREARANLANAHRKLATADRTFDKAKSAVREAESKAQQAAEARRDAEAKSIDTAKAATEARERSEAAADRAKRAAERSDAFEPRSHEDLIDQAVGDGLRKFDAAEARKDFKTALKREAELLDNDADRLETDAKTPGASAETKAAATRAREAADRAAARLRDKFPPLFPPRRAKPTPETIPPDTEQPPHIDPFPLIPGFPPVGDPTAFTTGGQPVSANVTVFVDNRPKILICIPPGADAAKIAAALGLTSHYVVAKTSTGTVIAAHGDPQAIEAKAKAKGIPLCFVETNFCMIMTPLTAFRGHVHELHRGGVHDHDAPDPPWSWSLTPPEPVVSWGGR